MVDDLKLLYAMVKRRKVSPVKFMMNQWKEVFELKGDVECTSLVICITHNLGLLDNASISPIDIPHWYIDYEYFLKTHMLKKKENGQLVMMYLGYTNEIPLPNRELGLYTVNSFLINLQVSEAAPRRSASTRLTHNP
jgi:hypothetical protein